MTRWVKLGLAILVAFAITPGMTVFAQSNADCDFFGTQSSGASYCITTPPEGFWNQDLVIFAHGYVSVTEPVDIPWSQMTFSDGTGGTITLPELVNGMGYAFATTSYSQNGLAVKEGISDIQDLVNIFHEKVGTTNHVYLVGASEGGLVTALTMERFPEKFSGGMELCGPVGNFRGQVNYWGDFRVVFDYFMDTPDLKILPGNAVNIPKALMMKWDSVYVPRIAASLASNPAGVGQFLNVTGAPSDPYKAGETSLGILWYNVFATNDAINKLGGQPFDNRDRIYTGSYNDTLLNAVVKRFKASPAALAEIAANYETTGLLSKPMVAMHTSGDPIVPAWHQVLYTQKVFGANPAARFVPMMIERYGHCAFTLPEIMQGFGTLVYMTTGIPPVLPPVMNANPEAGAYMLNR